MDKSSEEKTSVRSVLLDEENGIDVELIPVTSSQVNSIGYKDDGLYVEYRDSVWRYETPDAKFHFETMIHKNEIGASVGHYVTERIKPLPGKKVAVLE